MKEFVKINKKVIELIFRILGMEKSTHCYFENKAFKKLKRYQNRNSRIYKILPLPMKANTNVCVNKTIWIYWKQGFENAPDVVKACYKSVLKYRGDWQLITLTEKNKDEYIQLPEFLERLHEAGEIGEANYSDIVRTMLLIQYGGIWLDATCLMTSEIPKEIEDADFFMFQNANWWP